MPSKHQIPKGKTQLNIIISDDLYKKLLEIAPAWYGKNRGSFSALVEEALRLWFAHTNLHTNPAKSVSIVYSKVVEKVKEKLKMEVKPYEVSEKLLDIAIAEIRGSDPRTVSKWKNAFLKMGLIRILRGREPNRIFEFT